ncbi:hypothetical protein IGI04_039594 [Brassica rapa subsp. trilocularis]|uniref:Uncharacterized protein n=1 Tax=Brassica rapa subsp. trilocularis TaxID=1813537 RepID=A0ABQ7KPR8_BRACM|nr:hypothetical protein IGI04_039594 [Brassica rapa subsp. trilocularis]
MTAAALFAPELEALPQGNVTQDLDTRSPKETSSEEVLRITLTDPTTEVFPAVEDGSWEKVYGNVSKERATVEQNNRSTTKKQSLDENIIVVSPSRFSPLMGIEEEAEEVEDNVVEEVEIDVEEGEITGDARCSNARVASGVKKPSAMLNKTSKQRIVRAKDLKFAGRQVSTKRSSVRKL